MTTLERAKVVVVTPVKNEEWILERFLHVTSRFADLIIVVDQNSTDAGPAICRKFPKVAFFENPTNEYDEASRQLLLLEKARELVPGRRIILALDADEILAANAPVTIGWKTMLDAAPGTVLCFEKPDLYLSPNWCIRYETPWPVGYVDDGAAHFPQKVHSLRVPIPKNARRVLLHDVKILHYALTREAGQEAKHRLYSVLENLARSRTLLGRRAAYGKDISFYTRTGRLESSPCEWFAGWEASGIDMKTIITSNYHWQDFEVLRYFKDYGERRFWRDAIWSFDWEKCRLYAQTHGIPNIPETCIQKPFRSSAVAFHLMDRAYEVACAFRDRIIQPRKFTAKQN